EVSTAGAAVMTLSLRSLRFAQQRLDINFLSRRHHGAHYWTRRRLNLLRLLLLRRVGRSHHTHAGELAVGIAGAIALDVGGVLIGAHGRLIILAGRGAIALLHELFILLDLLQISLGFGLMRAGSNLAKSAFGGGEGVVVEGFFSLLKLSAHGALSALGGGLLFGGGNLAAQVILRVGEMRTAVDSAEFLLGVIQKSLIEEVDAIGVTLFVAGILAIDLILIDLAILGGFAVVEGGVGFGDGAEKARRLFDLVGICGGLGGAEIVIFLRGEGRQSEKYGKDQRSFHTALTSGAKVPFCFSR